MTFKKYPEWFSIWDLIQTEIFCKTKTSLNNEMVLIATKNLSPPPPH